MAVDFTIKQHDRLPEIQVTLLDALDTAVNVTGVSVRFVMNDKASGVNVVNSPATIVTPASGIVKYSWDSDDTDTAGKFLGEFEVEFPDGRLETFPNDHYIQILVKEDLGGVE